MSAPTFSKVAIPVATRETGPNVYDEPVAGLKGTSDALSFTVPGLDDEKTNKELRDAKRLLRKAGETNGVTVRISTDAEGTAKAPVVRITFWTVDRITRPRKPKDEDGNGARPVEENASNATEGAPTQADA